MDYRDHKALFDRLQKQFVQTLGRRGSSKKSVRSASMQFHRSLNAALSPHVSSQVGREVLIQAMEDLRDLHHFNQTHVIGRVAPPKAVLVKTVSCGIRNLRASIKLLKPLVNSENEFERNAARMGLKKVRQAKKAYELLAEQFRENKLEWVESYPLLLKNTRKLLFSSRLNNSEIPKDVAAAVFGVLRLHELNFRGSVKEGGDLYRHNNRG